MAVIPSFLGLTLVVIVLIIITAGVKFLADKGGEDVIRNVYIYLVLFATLMMTIGGSVGAVNSVSSPPQ